MYKPSYISGYKFGTSMKNSDSSLLKLNMTKMFFVCFWWRIPHQSDAFAQIVEGTFLATTSHWSYSIKCHRKHTGFDL